MGGELVKMHTPESVPEFLDQNLWKIRPKKGHFYLVPQAICFKEIVLWLSVKTDMYSRRNT